MQTTLKLAGGEKWPSFFSALWHREAFHSLGVQDVSEFDLIDTLSSAYWKKKKKKKRGKARGLFSQD
jgi:hypothetical protein